MISDLLSPEDPRWRTALSRLPHDIYHLPEYVRFSARHEGGRPAALYAECDGAVLLAPLVLRPLPAELADETGRSDAMSPYGYSTPLFTSGTDLGCARELLAAAAVTAQQHGVICAFFRLHPLLPMPLAEPGTLGVAHWHGETVRVDLEGTLAETTAEVRSGHRYEIRKLQRAGFTASIGWDGYENFVSIYLETMDRVSADAYYMFSRAYFQEMRDALGDALHLCTVAAPDGSIAAAGLFSEFDGIVQYLFSGTAEPFLRQAPSKLMLNHVIEWAWARGHRILHLGGGMGAREDSLFRFKAGFSKKRNPFGTWRLIFDSARYDALVDRWRVVSGAPAVDEGFFPAYRSSMLASTEQ